MRASEIAERALLGALLLEPARHAEVSQWLETEDFYAHRHALIYSTALDVRRAGEVPTPRAVLDRIMPDPVSRRNVDGPFLHTLMEACPHPDRAAVYGRMVLEASIHRRTAERAMHLDYVARSDSPADVVFDQLEREFASWVAASLALQERWKSAGGDDHAVDIDRVAVANEPALTSGAAELGVVASLVRYPWQYDDIKDWLTPDDFTRRDMAVVYAAMCDVADRELPVDQVTVMWAVLQRGAFSKDFDYEVLGRLSDAGVPGYAAVAAREVLRASVCRSTSRTARELGMAASTPEVNPASLLRAVHSDIQKVSTATHRWATATEGDV